MNRPTEKETKMESIVLRAEKIAYERKLVKNKMAWYRMRAILVTRLSPLYLSALDELRWYSILNMLEDIAREMEERNREGPSEPAEFIPEGDVDFIVDEYGQARARGTNEQVRVTTVESVEPIAPGWPPITGRHTLDFKQSIEDVKREMRRPMLKEKREEIEDKGRRKKRGQEKGRNG